MKRPLKYIQIAFSRIIGAASYDILSANVEYVPVSQYVELDSQKEEDAFKKLITLLNESEMVTGVYHNCNIKV